MLLKKIDAHAELQLLAPANYLNILFRFEPEGSLGEAELENLNVAICKAMLKRDLGFVDYARYKGKLGIRYILANSDLTANHVEQFLSHCLCLGKELSGR